MLVERQAHLHLAVLVDYRRMELRSGGRRGSVDNLAAEKPVGEDELAETATVEEG